MKRLMFMGIACIFGLTSLTALAQPEKYEILVCTNSGKKVWHEQADNLYCGANDQKLTIDQLYASGYRLVSSYQAAQPDTRPFKTIISFFFEKKK